MQLLKVQDVDEELQILEEAKGKYPAEISHRKAEIEGAEKILTDLNESLDDLEKQQRHLERELGASKEQLAKQEERFADVSTNKQYDALQLEIEASKTRMSEYETQILQIIEAAEKTREQQELEKQEVDDVRQAQQSRIDELEEKLSTLQAEVDGVQARRKAAEKGIDDALLKSYERSRNNRGRRVAAVRRGSCGACFRQLPAQVKSNTRRNDQVIHCESCGAILVWDGQSS